MKMTGSKVAKNNSLVLLFDADYVALVL